MLLYRQMVPYQRTTRLPILVTTEPLPFLPASSLTWAWCRAPVSGVWRPWRVQKRWRAQCPQGWRYPAEGGGRHLQVSFGRTHFVCSTRSLDMQGGGYGTVSSGRRIIEEEEEELA
jgi:hypothetical protein